MEPKEVDVYVQSKFITETGEWEVSTYVNPLGRTVEGATGTGQIMKRPLVATSRSADKAIAEAASLDDLKKQVADEALPGKVQDVRNVKMIL